MIAGLTIVRRSDSQAKAEKRATTLELLVQQGSFEVTRQWIAAGSLFYLDASSDWEGFEFIYVLAGVVLLKDGDVVLHPGDYVYHRSLAERAHFRAEEDVELLLVSSPPSFHLMRDEIQEMMNLVRSVGKKDEETEDHCHRLERLAVLTGERLGLSSDQLINLSYAAYLHDVGKVKVPDVILNKPGPLTNEERAEMRKHPSYGEEMLREKGFLSQAAKIVGAHHEHYDGSGYPKGLHGDQIPIEAQIVAVVDAYDAMTSDRPYRRARSPEEACRELEKNAGTQFGPRVVATFLNVLRRNRVT